MGDKKQKEAAQKRWKKIIFVVVAIMFVFIMVISSMGTRWITGLSPIKAGDAVVLDYTVYDSSGNPFLTTSQQVYKDQVTKGYAIMYARDKLSLTANQTLKQAILPVPAYVATANGGSWQEFALYYPEFNAISNGVVGMKTNEKKKVLFPTNSTMTAMFSPEDLERVNLNIDTLNVGDSLTMGVSENENASVSNTTAATYLRLGQVIRKTTDGVAVEFGYPYAEISVYSFTGQ
jgi:hypothetical protein